MKSEQIYYNKKLNFQINLEQINKNNNKKTKTLVNNGILFIFIIW